ncbi:MAG: ABC transporter ATP-binding protein [Bifidobacteriaceae bacterium]|jgi:ABC-2 type transport system ATP-binding protein|nr:ABC transporter ATP-binding protein [Bifidobacteriaceae bacterium]
MAHGAVDKEHRVGRLASVVEEKGSASSVVDVTDLTVVRGGRAVLDGLDLTVPAGQVVGLLGPSGSGKTTLMRAIVGVQRVASGRVTVLGRPAGSPVLRHLVGYQTQAPAVYPDLTVWENLTYFARVAGTGPDDAARVLDAVHLGPHRHDPVRRLSGGERARVSLAVALLGRPELLVLDEPTVGLDPVLRRDLWDLFGALAAGGVSLLVSSHVMDEAAHCDRLIMLRAGRIVWDGTLPALLATTGTGDAEAAFLAVIGHGEPAVPDGHDAGGDGPDGRGGRAS